MGGQTEKLKKTVAVYSNDPKTPRLELTLKADVVQDIKVDPPSLNFGDVILGSKTTGKIALEILEPKKVSIESVTCADTRFVAKKKSESAGGKSEWEITFLGGETKETVEVPMVFKTKGTDYPQIEVSMWLNLVGPIRSPYQVYFFKRRGKYRETTFTLESRSKDAPFKVTDIRDPDDNLRFDVVRESPTKTVVKANLKDPKRILETSLQGTVKIKTTAKRDPTIEVQYTVKYQKGPRLH